jgi:hypothetical protein
MPVTTFSIPPDPAVETGVRDQMFGDRTGGVLDTGVQRCATADVKVTVPGSSAWKPGEMANQDRDARGVAGSGEVRDMSVAAAWGWCVAGCLTWWWAVAWLAVRLAGL